MRGLRFAFITFLLCILLIYTAPAHAAGLPGARDQGVGPARPVVRGVLFYITGCAHCDEVLLNVLPPLQQQYGDQLDILLIELVTSQDVDQLYAIGASYNLTRTGTGVPLLVIGERVLVGDAQIKAELPGLIEASLAAGGVDYPTNPLVAAFVPTPTPAVAPCAPATPCPTDTYPQPTAASYLPVVGGGEQPPAEPQTSPGLALAAIVAVCMGLALLATILVIVRAYLGQPAPGLPAWLDWGIPVLSLVGMGVAGYLTYVEYWGAIPICGPIGGCEGVQASQYAWVIKDVLGVGLVGLLGYIAILVAWLWGRYRSDWLAKNAPLALFGMTFFGTVYSLYLTFIELFVLKEACVWCLASAVIITLQLLLCLVPAAQAIEVEDEDLPDE